MQIEELVREYATGILNDEDIDWLLKFIEEYKIEERHLKRVRKCTNNEVIVDVIDILPHVLTSHREKDHISRPVLKTQASRLTGIIFTEFTKNILTNSSTTIYPPIEPEIFDAVDCSYIQLQRSGKDYRRTLKVAYKLLDTDIPKNLVYKLAPRLMQLQANVIVHSASVNLSATVALIENVKSCEVLTILLLEVINNKHLIGHYLRNKESYQEMYDDSNPLKISIHPFVLTSTLEIMAVKGEIDDDYLEAMLPFYKEPVFSGRNHCMECISLLYLVDKTLLSTYIPIINDMQTLKSVIIEYVLSHKQNLLNEYANKLHYLKLESCINYLELLQEKQKLKGTITNGI